MSNTPPPARTFTTRASVPSLEEARAMSAAARARSIVAQSGSVRTSPAPRPTDAAIVATDAAWRIADALGYSRPTAAIFLATGGVR